MSVNVSGVIKSIRDIMREDRGINGDAQRIEQLSWLLFLKIFDDKDIELESLNSKYKSPIPKKYQWRSWAGNSEGMTGDELLDFTDKELFPKLKELSVPAEDRRGLLVKKVFEDQNNYMKSGTNLRKVLNKLNEIDFNRAKERHMFGEFYETLLKELQSAGAYGEFYTPRAITEFMTEMIDPKLGEIIYDPACGTGGFLTCAVEHIRSKRKELKTEKDFLKIQESVRGTEYKPLPFTLALTNLILHDIAVPNLDYDDSLSREFSSITSKDRVDVVLANPPFGGVVSHGYEKNFPQSFRTKESADLFLILIIQYLKEGGRAAVVLPDGSLGGDGIKARIREKLLTDCNLHTIVRLPNSVFKPYAGVATNLLFFEKGKPTKDVWYYEHSLPEGLKAYSMTRPIAMADLAPIKEWWKKRKESESSWQVSFDSLKKNGWVLDIKNPNKKDEQSKHDSGDLMKMLEASFLKSNALLAELRNAIQ